WQRLPLCVGARLRALELLAQCDLLSKRPSTKRIIGKNQSPGSHAPPRMAAHAPVTDVPALPARGSEPCRASRGPSGQSAQLSAGQGLVMSQARESIILVGGGGHCRSVIDVIEQQGKYQIIGIVDLKELIGQQVLGYPVIGCDDQLPELLERCRTAVITVGHLRSNDLRLKLYELLKDIGYALPVIISPL